MWSKSVWRVSVSFSQWVILVLDGWGELAGHKTTSNPSVLCRNISSTQNSCIMYHLQHTITYKYTISKLHSQWGDYVSTITSLIKPWWLNMLFSYLPSLAQTLVPLRSTHHYWLDHSHNTHTVLWVAWSRVWYGDSTRTWQSRLVYVQLTSLCCLRVRYQRASPQIYLQNSLSECGHLGVLQCCRSAPTIQLNINCIFGIRLFCM